MKTGLPSFQILGPRERVASAVAALTCCVGTVGAIVLCFYSDAPETWSLPTPKLMADVARCELQRSRTARDQCKQPLATQGLAREPNYARLAIPDH